MGRGLEANRSFQNHTPLWPGTHSIYCPSPLFSWRSLEKPGLPRPGAWGSSGNVFLDFFCTVNLNYCNVSLVCLWIKSSQAGLRCSVSHCRSVGLCCLCSLDTWIVTIATGCPLLWGLGTLFWPRRAVSLASFPWKLWSSHCVGAGWGSAESCRDESAWGYTVHRGLGWKIGAAVEPQGSVWLPRRFLVPGTQERAQRRSCLYTRCTEERSGDAVMGGGVDEQGWRRRRQP